MQRVGGQRAEPMPPPANRPRASVTRGQADRPIRGRHTPGPQRFQYRAPNHQRHGCLRTGYPLQQQHGYLLLQQRSPPTPLTVDTLHVTPPRRCGLAPYRSRSSKTSMNARQRRRLPQRRRAVQPNALPRIARAQWLRSQHATRIDAHPRSTRFRGLSCSC
jgi:hypothetical protein